MLQNAASRPGGMSLGSFTAKSCRIRVLNSSNSKHPLPSESNLSNFRRISSTSMMGMPCFLDSMRLYLAWSSRTRSSSKAMVMLVVPTAQDRWSGRVSGSTVTLIFCSKVWRSRSKWGFFALARPEVAASSGSIPRARSQISGCVRARGNMRRFLILPFSWQPVWWQLLRPRKPIPLRVSSLMSNAHSKIASTKARTDDPSYVTTTTCHSSSFRGTPADGLMRVDAKLQPRVPP
mmetsp:Transcript_72903/g.194567  ORF Transcript_72903/g.194567 Transcript_72903/m.194567 type:complete len:234 (+) Transcript_72903:239-940(+)